MKIDNRKIYIRDDNMEDKDKYEEEMIKINIELREGKINYNEYNKKANEITKKW